MEKKEYLKKIELLIKKLTKTNYQLSSKERALLEKFYEDKIPVNLIEKEVKKIFSHLPSHRKRRFSLLMLRELKNKPLTNRNREKKEEKPFKKWKIFIEKYNLQVDIPDSTGEIPLELLEEEIRLKIVNALWKRMTKEEKEKIKNEAVSRLKKSNLPAKKDILKAFIRKVIEEIYNLP